jgi:hypothetical protein
MRFHLHVVLNKTSTPHELFKHVCLLRYRPLLYYQLKHQDQLQSDKHAQETSYQEAHNKPNPLPQQNSHKPELRTPRIQNILVSLNVLNTRKIQSTSKDTQTIFTQVTAHLQNETICECIQREDFQKFTVSIEKPS